MLDNELEILIEIDYHPNIIKLHGICKLNNLFTLLLEYCNLGDSFFYFKYHSNCIETMFSE